MWAPRLVEVGGLSREILGEILGGLYPVWTGMRRRKESVMDLKMAVFDRNRYYTSGAQKNYSGQVSTCLTHAHLSSTHMASELGLPCSNSRTHSSARAPQL